jgi:hypothetical protein
VRNRVWLLLVGVPFLVAVCVFKRASTPSSVSGPEIPQPAAAAVPAPAPEPQPVAATSCAAMAQLPSQPAVPAAATAAGPVEQEESPRGSVPNVAAILADTDNRFRALVGDALVSEGSTVRGYRVGKVHADRVEFEKDGRIWVQKLD